MDVDYRQPLTLTPNRVVAYNLARARSLRGWTQEQAAERLEPFLGVRWSKATFSAAERSYGSERVREFTADDLVAFAQTFELPVIWFLLPPPPDSTGRPSVVLGRDEGDGTGTYLTAAAFLEALFGAPRPELRKVIDQRVREALAQTPPELRTPAQAQAAQLASRVMGQVMEEVIGDLAIWSHNLRDLAGYMDDIQEMTRERLREEQRGRKGRR